MRLNMVRCSGKALMAKNYPSIRPILSGLRNPGLIRRQEHIRRDVLGGPVVKTFALSMQGMWVPSLVREL